MNQTDGNAICGLIRGGGIALLLLALSSCATLHPSPEGPPPRPETIEAFIYQWDRAERSSKPCPEVYRELYAQSLKALSASLAETEKWRARAEK